MHFWDLFQIMWIRANATQEDTGLSGWPELPSRFVQQAGLAAGEAVVDRVQQRGVMPSRASNGGRAGTGNCSGSAAFSKKASHTVLDTGSLLA